MKKMNKLTVAALALVAIGLASTAASAQVSAGPFDLVLGFQQTSASTGNIDPTDLEVDLGPITNLNLASGAVTNLSADISSTDLSNTFGSSWNSTSVGTGVQWSVAGINAVNDSASFYLTATGNNIKTSSSGTLGTPWSYISDLTQPNQAVNGALNGATVAGTSKSSLISSSLTYSYSSLEQANGYTFQSSAEAVGAGTDTLYSFVPGTSSTKAVKLGVFSLADNSGVESFTFTAVSTPEPSAYALGICAAVLFFVLRRRAKVA